MHALPVLACRSRRVNFEQPRDGGLRYPAQWRTLYIMRSALLCLVALLAFLALAQLSTAHRGRVAPAKMAAWHETWTQYRCQKCQANVELVNLEAQLFNSTVASCEAGLANNCRHTLNATADNICFGVARQICTNAVDNVPAQTTCTDLGYCSSAKLPSVVEGFWGECGACQDTIQAGLEIGDEIVCEGLSDTLSVFCDVGAPVCAGVLEAACDAVVAYVFVFRIALQDGAAGCRDLAWHAGVYG